MESQSELLKRYLGVLAFAVGFAFVESSVVVYLRALYYPEGFDFPLAPMHWRHFAIEVTREAATIVMLIAVAVLAGKGRWQQFGFFLIAFAVWDILYYVWLKVLLDWPSSLLDWDILFLIPIPWIGPVIAPVLISVAMLVAGNEIVRRESRGIAIAIYPLDVLLLILGTVLMLYTFMKDTDATMGYQMPQSYPYFILAVGLVFWLVAGIMIWRRKA